MSDEMERLARVDRVSRPDVEDAVRLDRSELLDLLRQDASASAASDATVTSINSRSRGRGVYVGIGAVAAAIAVMVGVSGLRSTPDETVVGDVATQPTTTEDQSQPSDDEGNREALEIEIESDDSQATVSAPADSDSTPSADTSEPAGTATTIDDDVTDSGSSTSTVEPTPGPVECRGRGSDLPLAVKDYERSCDQPRLDCDQLGAEWICSSELIGTGAPNQPWELPGDSANQPQRSYGDFSPENDVLSLHYRSPRADAATVAATYELLNRLGLVEQVLVTTDETLRPTVQAIWGEDRSVAMDTAGSSELASRWLDVFDAGGVVWVSDGEQHQFTAGVERLVLERRPGTQDLMFTRVQGDYVSELTQIFGLTTDDT